MAKLLTHKLLTFRYLFYGSALLFIVGSLIPPHVNLLEDPTCLIVEDNAGILLSAQIAKDEQWRFPHMDTLPDQFVRCITTFEDKRFYRHGGIDIWALGRAIMQNLRAQKVISGASTITMQVARLNFRNQPRTFINKLKEMIWALRLEAHYSKDEILKIYATHAPFGGNVVGVETAAWRYFNKPIHALSWAQMATLAVLPNAPSLIRIDHNSTALLQKRNFLLQKLLENGSITHTDYTLSIQEKLPTRIYAMPQTSMPLLHWLSKQDNTKYRYRTTINRQLQSHAENTLDFLYQEWQAQEVHNGAILVIDNFSGKVLSYVANIPSSKAQEQVDMIQAPRSSGSILKPLLYAAVLEEGTYTPSSWVEDIPVFYKGFTPQNYNRQYYGLVPLDQALSQSLNVPFVTLLKAYGVEKFRKYLQRLGLSTITRSSADYGLSLILGGAETTLWELTQLYGRMAHKLQSATDSQHNKHWSSLSISPQQNDEPARDIPLTASTLYHTLEAMEQLQRPDEFGHWQSFTSTRRMAWKTGTSFGHRDAWAIGVTPRYTIGVWVGNADGEGRNTIVGSKLAGRALFHTLEGLEPDDHWFDEPVEEMEYVELCQDTGYPPGPHCPKLIKKWLAPTCLRAPTCQYHQQHYLDSTARYLVNRDCYAADDMVVKSFLHLSPQVTYYYARHHVDYQPAPPYHPACQAHVPSTSQVQITYPHQGEKIFIPKDFGAETQRLVAQAVHPSSTTVLYWYHNEKFLGTTQTFHQMAIPHLSQGTHTLLCIDEAGNQSSVIYSILDHS